MNVYHVNPATGNVSVCRAKIQCPYGTEALHRSTVAEARTAYEQHMQSSAVQELSPRAFQNAWFDSLAAGELEALSFFSGPTHHRSFNERLRQNTPTKDDLLKASALDSALIKGPRGGPLQVSRGVLLKRSEFDALRNSGELHNAGYSSSTTKPSMAHMFAGTSDEQNQAVVFHFATSSRSFLDLGEKEILLPRTTFEVQKISQGKSENAVEVAAHLRLDK